MLSKHPITKILYKLDYNGRDDIYEYWLDHQKAIIEKYIELVQPSDLHADLYSFKCKIRWGSVFGLFLRLSINQMFRNIKHQTIDFSTITVRYGDKHLSIHDFSTWSKLPPTNNTDLRGISILKQHIQDVTIENVDFTHATLDYTTFHRVTFRNCCFNNTSFQRTNLLECKFESSCEMIHNNFSKAVIDSEFQCDVKHPIIRQKKAWMINSNMIRYTLRYPTFTILLNPSIVSKANDELLWKEYELQNKFRIRAKHILDKKSFKE